MNFWLVDYIVILSANVFNLIISIIMLSRVKQNKKMEHRLGLLSTGLIIPLLIGIYFNITFNRESWTFVLPGLLTIFLIVEYYLDYVLKSNFRDTRWLGPYLLMFYLSQWGMIGYGFGVQSGYGFVTLFTYFISLGATAFSYAKIRHGNQ